MKNLEKEIFNIFPKTKKEFPLAEFTAFGSGGSVQYFLELNRESEVVELFFLKKKYDFPLYFLGNGNNLLINSGILKGVVVKYLPDSKWSKTAENSLLFSSSCHLSVALNIAHKNNLKGLEGVTGIPGSVGGALKMNAGTSLGTISDALSSIRIITISGVKDISKEKFSFGYRSSNITKDQFISSANFSLKKVSVEEIMRLKGEMSDFNNKRKKSQPLGYPSFGSTFKNPAGFSAGKLIEDAGLKGKSVGSAVVSEKHANFILNMGNADSKDVFSLIEMIKEAVFKNSGILLQTEVELWGF